MMKINKIILLALAAFILVLVTFADKILVASSRCIYWHLTNKNVYESKLYSIDLPINWWIIMDKGNYICLERIPPIIDEYFANVIIENKTITKSELDSFGNVKIVKGKELKRNGNIIAHKINTEMAYSIEYVVENNDGENGKIYWTWTIPKKHLVIHALDLDPDHRQYLIDEIISNIIFH